MGHGDMGGYGYGSYSGLLGGLLVLLIKLLIAVLVIAVVVGVVIWIKNSFFKNANSQFMQALSKDPILKTVVYITVAIIGLVLLFGLLGSLASGGMGYGGEAMHGGGMGGLTTAISIGGIMALLIKVLTFVLIISLILALVAYIKKQYDLGVFHVKAQNTDTQNANAQKPDQQT